MPPNPPSRDRSRPLRKDAARNRALLVQSAREVFATRGFEASMDDIAHHAGLGVGTAYRHFVNKYELANAIFDTAVDTFVGSAERAMAAADPWAALVHVLERTLEAQTENRAIRQILLGVNQDDSGYRSHMLAPFGPLLDRAKAAGVVRPDAESSDIGIVLIMLCTVAETTAHKSPYLWRRYLPTLLAGLRPDGAPLPVSALAEDELHAAVDAATRHPSRSGGVALPA